MRRWNGWGDEAISFPLPEEAQGVEYIHKFRTGDTYEKTFERWKSLKTAASKAIVANGGTISHHHGVGVDHAPYLMAEKGELGIAASQLRAF